MSDPTGVRPTTLGVSLVPASGDQVLSIPTVGSQQQTYAVIGQPGSVFTLTRPQQVETGTSVVKLATPDAILRQLGGGTVSTSTGVGGSVSLVSGRATDSTGELAVQKGDPQSLHSYTPLHTMQVGSTVHHQPSSPTKTGMSGSANLAASSPGAIITNLQRHTFLTSNNKTSTKTALSPSSSPQQPRKKIKTEDKLPGDDMSSFRSKILEHKMGQLIVNKENYNEHVAELFFLDNQGNMMDYPAWRRKPTTEFLKHARKCRLDSDDEGDLEVQVPTVGGTPVAVSTTLPAAVSRLPHQGSSSHDSLMKSPTRDRSSGSLSMKDRTKHSLSHLQRQTGRHDSSREHIAQKAKQEAYVVQRILELQREGLWSEKRLPKVQEQPRVKAHWDYLLEEMQWMATDFTQERKWKKVAAKKCARMVQKYFQDQEIAAQKAERDQETKLRRIAAFVAKEVKTFWGNVEKLIEYKTQLRLEEKRKKALDQHLSFIVDQTEKYSALMAESLNQTPAVGGVDSRVSSATPSLSGGTDDEFEPDQHSSTDDEETIAREEEEQDSNQSHQDEIVALKMESELPLDEVLKQLPDDYMPMDRLQGEAMKSATPSTDVDMTNDEEFHASSDESGDDEATIQEQEAVEKVDHKQEISDLQKEGEMPLEELLKKYQKGNEEAAEVLEEMEGDASEAELDSDDDLKDEEMEEDEEEEEEEEEESEDDGVGLKSLLEESGPSSEVVSSSPEKHIQDVAAMAETFQPKGINLASTQVKTKVPSLLKHNLREYQHIGLDWLVTLYERRLNGILADEMGLGKTIQTIALLAHLACEKGNWGPHLIVVPTSVMLNWEMEFKKWCPGFKILVYYGNQKERRQKRIGWTKPNVFHVCITSYKLVIQDHQAFRRKKWKYFVLDEAQNIKNFKSQRWQLLLNFKSQRRLLLTGTPLQNNLMELWSLLHFLMPHVFQSHREFREWFSAPVTGMIEGTNQYNDSIIKRLHKVLRPFLLRRLKSEVEKQLPKKYEHIVMCKLSKRQRYLYEDFMSRAKTKETLASGNMMSVINVLMQLRKVCNHPNLFESRPIISPFQMERIVLHTASLVTRLMEYDPFDHINLFCWNLLLTDLEVLLTAFAAHRIKKFQTPRKLVEEMDSLPLPAPPCPRGKIKLHVRPSNSQSQQQMNRVNVIPRGVSPTVNKTILPQPGAIQTGTVRPSSVLQVPQYMVQAGGQIRSVPIVNNAQVQSPSLPVTARVTGPQIQPGFAQLLQMNSGQQLLLTASPQSFNLGGIVLPGGQRLALISRPGTPGMSVTRVGPTNHIAQPAVSTTLRPTAKLSPLTVVAQSGLATNTAATTTTVLTKPVPAIMTTSTSTPKRTDVPIAQDVKPIVNSLDANNTPKTLSLGTNSKYSTRAESRSQDEQKQVKEKVDGERKLFHSSELELVQRDRRKLLLSFVGWLNARRCEACPIYGADLIAAVQAMDGSPSPLSWSNGGYLHCVHSANHRRTASQFWNQTHILSQLVRSPEDHLVQLHDVISRYVFCVPSVTAPSPILHVSHPSPSDFLNEGKFHYRFHQEFQEPSSLLHCISNQMVTLFPEARLIQYDCGKLQTLDRLLRELKTGSHRVLIFTQMTRMLDVLEAFLNFHGHIYLRLDGTTRVDQRQALMERFNADKRIFCFILSTRSGGIGVNLTGADTVIFYDSDWNPTMDAQAQDRCHRIGQTRDVHIYRLISEKTIEENILKKANQKRLLGDVAIEGGQFTTTFFKKETIQDLFEVNVDEQDAKKRLGDFVTKDQKRSDSKQKEEESSERTAVNFLESALAAAEDEADVKAARVAKAEAAAELAEFDESVPLEENGEGEEVSRVEVELRHIVKQLTPVERYAMRFMEEVESWSEEQLAAAEREIEEQKQEWEMGRLQFQPDQPLDEDDEELTYSSEDARNQVNNEQVKRGRGRPPKSASIPNGLDSSSEEDEDEGGSESSESIDKKSPRTRSRGSVNIDLWTLDEKPLMPTNTSVGSNGPVTPTNSRTFTTSTPIHEPFANPNLVIRTRRASVKTGSCEKDRGGTKIDGINRSIRSNSRVIK